jgi:transcriptional regulator with XRE-family HTH domain
MKEQRFRYRLQRAWEERRQNNSRYSLRAFAVFLGADHSTVSQVLRGLRRASTSQIRAWSAKLGMSREEAAAFVAAEHLPDESAAQRERHLRHWSAEALQLIADRTHWEIVRSSRIPGFRLDCRSFARQVSVSVDDVNMALSRLLRLGLIGMEAHGTLIDLTRLDNLGQDNVTEAKFRRMALIRVREKAASSLVNSSSLQALHLQPSSVQDSSSASSLAKSSRMQSSQVSSQVKKTRRKPTLQ